MQTKKILFCATTPMNYAMFKTIHLRLKQDERLELWFTANHNTKKLYRSIGLENENIIGKYRSMLTHYDMRICPSYFYKRNNADIKIQIFHGCSLKNRCVNKRALDYDKLFLVGPYIRQKFIETWNIAEDDKRLENIGMPKLDPFFDGSLNKKAIMKGLNLDPKLPTVIYAPTRTAGISSSTDMFGRQIISTLCEMPVNFLVKLHDRAYKQWKSRMKEDWIQILEDYRVYPRFRPIYDYDVVPYLFISDLLISDISSVVNEFTLLDRPIVLIAVPRLISHHKRIELKRGLKSCDLEDWGQDPGLVVKDMDKLSKVVTHCLEHPEEKQKIRREFARKFFFNPGHATSKAVAKVYELLGLDLPEQSQQSKNHFTGANITNPVTKFPEAS